MNLARVTTTRTTTTTIERLFQLFEEGMEGWDAEVAMLVPGLDRFMDLKLLGGYYSFDNQPFGPQTGGTGNVEGFKAGVELRPVPAVVLTATWYEDERFVGSDWLYGAQLQIPFEMGDLGDGKNFWGRMKDSFTPRRRHLAERLAEPVRRQNEAIKVGNSVEEETKVSVTAKTVTKVVSQGPQQIILVNDVIFVNNGGPVGNGIQTGSDVTGNGTAELPFSTIQTGATVAQVNSNVSARIWNVYTQGTAAGYTENVVTNTGSVNFIGSGRLIQGLEGKTFGAGPAPALTGGFSANNIGFFGLTAYRIAGGLTTGDADAIRLLNVRNFVIDGNTITSPGSDGLEIDTNGSVVSNGRVFDNSIAGAGDEGVEMDVIGSSVLNMVLTNNRFTNGSSDDVDGSTESSGLLNLQAVQNTFSGGANDAFEVVSYDASTLNFTAVGNTVLNGGDDGIFMESNGTSRLNAIVTDNVLSTIVDDGVDFDAFDASVISLTALRNNFSFMGGDAVTVYLENDATGVANISQNNISVTGDEGVEFFLTGGDVSMTASVNQNYIIATGSDSIDTSAFLGAEMFLTSNNNTIIASQTDGFDLQAHSAGQITANLANNFITNTVGYGMYLRADFGGQLDVNVLGGTIANAGDSSIYASTDIGVTAELNLVVTGSTFLNARLDHIQTYSGAFTDLNTTVTGSIFRTLGPADGSAIYAVADDGSDQIIRLFGNDMANTNPGPNGSSGIVIVAQASSDIDLAASGNLLTNFAFSPIYVEAADAAGVIASVTNNIVSGMVGGISPSNGIEFFADGGDIDITALTGNSVTGAAGRGISLGVVDGGTIDATAISNNTVIGAADNGIAFEINNGGFITALAVSDNTVRDSAGAGPAAGISLITNTLGSISIAGFDRNTILNVTGDGVLLIEGAGTSISINGTINTGNNIIDNVGGARVFDPNVSADGTFHLGAPVNANRAADTSVP